MSALTYLTLTRLKNGIRDPVSHCLERLLERGNDFFPLRREPSLPLPHSPDPHAILRPPAANQHSTLAGHLSLLPIWMAS